MTRIRIPRRFEEDKNKVFCKVREINSAALMAAARRRNRIYYRCGAVLLPCNFKMLQLRRLAKRGWLYLWTGDRDVD